MTSDIDLSFNQNYPSSVAFTNTQISRSKSSPIHEHTRSARDDEYAPIANSATTVVAAPYETVKIQTVGLHRRPTMTGWCL